MYCNLDKLNRSSILLDNIGKLDKDNSIKAKKILEVDSRCIQVTLEGISNGGWNKVDSHRRSQ